MASIARQKGGAYYWSTIHGISPAQAFREIDQADPPTVLPSVTLSVAGARRESGVSVAEISLKPVQEMVTSTKVGDHGAAYVVDAGRRVIAHSDVTMVQRDFSSVAHLQAAAPARLQGRLKSGAIAIAARSWPPRFRSRSSAGWWLWSCRLLRLRRPRNNEVIA
jgi:hypothetical protein